MCVSDFLENLDHERQPQLSNLISVFKMSKDTYPHVAGYHLVTSLLSVMWSYVNIKYALHMSNMQ